MPIVLDSQNANSVYGYNPKGNKMNEVVKEIAPGVEDKELKRLREQQPASASQKDLDSKGA